MANQKQLELLKQGSTVWNAWRLEVPKRWPDLNGADFRDTNLSNANLIYGDLSHTDLRNADLNNANLHKADLSNANLNGANLLNADLTAANLSNADLSNANLRFAQLRYANLNGACFHATHLDSTTLAGVNLRAVKGLDTVIHDGPSIVDVKMVKLPEGETLTLFLRGVGFSDAFIDYLPSLLTAAIQYASCFISYAHQDEALARRLYKDLQNKGVRCWFAPEDMKIGDKIRPRIDEAIHLQEKLLLLLSEHSLASFWVEFEVEAALEREQLQGCNVLFPVRFGDAVMQTTKAWAATLRRTRHIGDFTRWTDSLAYQQAFERLLRDLKKADERSDQEMEQ